MAGRSGRSQQENSASDYWNPTLAPWEKEFFREVGSMDWDEMVRVRQSIHLFPDVMRWNDSAAKEAIIDAKRRYWAQKNRVACDIALPDPNLYIDEIDWDAKLDPLLVQEFEGARAVSDDEDQIVRNGDSVMPSYLASQAYPWHGSFNGWPAWPGANYAWQAWPNGPWHGYNTNGAWLGYSNYAPNMHEHYNYAPNMHESNARAYEPQVNEERRSYSWRNGNRHRRPPYARRQRDRRSTPRDSDAIQLTGGSSSNQE